MILLRTHKIDQDILSFARNLRSFSKDSVAFIVDERTRAIDTPDDFAKISLTFNNLRELGVYCPNDFAWRCGDYGVYLAQKAFPDEAYFWIIENDVRIVGTNPAVFFDHFRDVECDLLASYLEKSQDDWYWKNALRSSERDVYKCFFPVVRLSAKAVNVLLADRKRHSRRLVRRAFWPNDEGFVATSLAAAGLDRRDLNACGETFYSPGSFSFDTVLDEAALPAPAAPARLLHPVLSGEAMRSKQERLARRDPPKTWWRRQQERLARRLGMRALAGMFNARERW